MRSFLTVRLAVGVLGLLLPFFLAAAGYRLDKAEGYPRTRGSLSEYYYSGAGEVFVAVLATIAVFLIAYRLFEGKSLENWLSILSGFCVLAVVLFPTGRPLFPATV